jgi:hypothetical protein
MIGWNASGRILNGLNILPFVLGALVAGSWWIAECTDLDSPVSIVGGFCFLGAWDYVCVVFLLRAMGIPVDKADDTGYTDQR